MARLSLVPEDRSDHAWEVEVNLGMAHVSVAQAVATALAIDLDFDLEAVDDVRIATNEVCTELASHARPQAILHLVSTPATTRSRFRPNSSPTTTGGRSTTTRTRMSSGPSWTP